jgi:hypothetical protein
MGETMDITPVTSDKYPLQMWGMNLGLYEVKIDNWYEFFVRIRLYEQLQDGPMLNYSDTNEPVTITPELAKQHIGCTLGCKIETRDEWWLRIMKGRARSLEYEVESVDPNVEFPRSEDDDEF